MRVAARGAQDEILRAGMALDREGEQPAAPQGRGGGRENAIERAEIHEHVGGGDEIGARRREADGLQVGLHQPVVDVLGARPSSASRPKCRSLPERRRPAAAARPSGRCRSRGRRHARNVSRRAADRLGEQVGHAVAERFDQRAGRSFRAYWSNSASTKALGGAAERGSRADQRQLQRRARPVGRVELQRHAPGFAPPDRRRPPPPGISPRRNQPIAQPGASSSAPSISSAAAAGRPSRTASRHSRRGGRR